MQRFHTLFRLLFIAGAVFGLTGLRYLPFFFTGHDLPPLGAPGAGAWGGRLQALFNWALATNPGMSADYRHALFLAHVTGGCLYLFTAPRLLARVRHCGVEAGKRRLLALAVFLPGLAMMPWPLYFLRFVHAHYDVSWFIVLTILAMWILFFCKALQAFLAGQRDACYRYLASHYAMSLGALFYRIVYFAIDGLEHGIDPPYAVPLQREHLTMAYHTAWFLALVFAVGLCKLLLFRPAPAGAEHGMHSRYGTGFASPPHP